MSSSPLSSSTRRATAGPRGSDTDGRESEYKIDEERIKTFVEEFTEKFGNINPLLIGAVYAVFHVIEKPLGILATGWLGTIVFERGWL
jgi:hypothetical protein